MSANSITIDIASQAQMIIISAPGSSPQSVNKKDLTVVPLFNGNPNYPKNYRYPTRCTVTLKSSSGKVMMEFEAQDTTNAAWNTGTQAALTQCVSDIATWIST